MLGIGTKQALKPPLNRGRGRGRGRQRGRGRRRQGEEDTLSEVRFRGDVWLSLK